MILDYTESVDIAHRKKFGQFFTHPSVARFMTRWISKSASDQVFDPAFGLGIFYAESSVRNKSSFRAMEVDTEIIQYWQRWSGDKNVKITQGDYLHTWGLKHENIVCNPPYMRFQKFLDRDAVFLEFQEHLGVRLSGYTNTASAFLIKSLSELKQGGRLAYIMPLEFLNAGYGIVVKEMLLNSASLFGIISFDCEKEIFPDATTSVGIILVDSSRSYESVKFFTVVNLDHLERFENIDPVAEIVKNDIDPKQKWLPYFQSRKIAVDANLAIALKFYGRFSRGIATGANEFFMLNRTKISELNLNEKKDCLPCISRSSQIKGSFFDQDDLDLLKKDDKPVFLFSVNGKHSSKAVSYVRDGESRGYHRRFLTKNRTPWYKTEDRKSAPLLLGVFSRGGYRIIRNRSNALNLTCYHGFQPNLFGIQYQEHLFLYLASKAGREIVALVSRKYGDSLDKFEPNDINEALVPTPEFFDSMAQEEIEAALLIFRCKGVIPFWIEKKFDQLKKPNKSREVTVYSRTLS